jgi:hypothetical protein
VTRTVTGVRPGIRTSTCSTVPSSGGWTPFGSTGRAPISRGAGEQVHVIAVPCRELFGGNSFRSGPRVTRLTPVVEIRSVAPRGVRPQPRACGRPRPLLPDTVLDDTSALLDDIAAQPGASRAAVWLDALALPTMVPALPRLRRRHGPPRPGAAAVGLAACAVTVARAPDDDWDLPPAAG